MNILTAVYDSGVVNQYQIVNDIDDQENKTQTQLIWNGQIHCIVVGLNENPTTYNTENKWMIKHYRAIYLNGIMIVKNGNVWPPKRRWWQSR